MVLELKRASPEASFDPRIHIPGTTWLAFPQVPRAGRLQTFCNHTWSCQIEEVLVIPPSPLLHHCKFCSWKQSTVNHNAVQPPPHHTSLTLLNSPQQNSPRRKKKPPTTTHHPQFTVRQKIISPCSAKIKQETHKTTKPHHNTQNHEARVQESTSLGAFPQLGPTHTSHQIHPWQNKHFKPRLPAKALHTTHSCN